MPKKEKDPSEELWNKIDEFLSQKLGTSDDLLEAALRDSEKAGLPGIQVTPNQGKLLQLLAQIQGARRILEMGTLGPGLRPGCPPECRASGATPTCHGHCRTRR